MKQSVSLAAYWNSIVENFYDCALFASNSLNNNESFNFDPVLASAETSMQTF